MSTETIKLQEDAPTPEVKPEALSDKEISDMAGNLNLQYEDEEFESVLRLFRSVESAIRAKQYAERAA